MAVNRRDAVIEASGLIKKYSRVSFLLLSICILLAFFSISQKYNSVFFAVNENNQIIKLVPLSKPNHTDASIMQWTTDALVDTFDFAFYNIYDRLNKSSSKWFTDEGSKSILSLLKRSGNFDAVIDEQLIVNLTLTDTPLILKKYKPRNSRYWRWLVRANGNLTFRTRTEKYTNNVMFNIVITRTGPTEIGISKIIMKNCQQEGYCT